MFPGQKVSLFWVKKITLYQKVSLLHTVHVPEKRGEVTYMFKLIFLFINQNILTGFKNAILGCVSNTNAKQSI